jgi:hypothetical protein
MGSVRLRLPARYWCGEVERAWHEWPLIVLTVITVP